MVSLAVIVFRDVASSFILIYDIPTGKTRMIDPGEYITTLIWGDDDHLIMACPADINTSRNNVPGSVLARTEHVNILCFDPKNTKELWRYDFTGTNTAVKSEFLLLPEKNAVAYFRANRADIFNIADGTLIASHNPNDSIIMGQISAGDDWPFYVTEKGGLAYPASADSITIDQHFADNLDQMFYSSESGFFAHPSNSSEIIHYGLHVCDEGLKNLKSGTDLSAPENAYMDDNVLAVLSYESPTDFPGAVNDTETEELLILTLADPATGEQRYRIPLTENGAGLRTYNLSFLGSEGTHFYIGHSSEQSGYRVLDIDLETGEYTDFILAEDELYIYGDFCTLSNGKFYYCRKHSDSSVLCIYDPGTKEITEYKISDEPDGPLFNNAPIVIPERNSVLLRSTDETILYDLNSGSSKKLILPTGWAPLLYAYDAGRDAIALSNKTDIRLFSLNIEADLIINCPSTPLGMSFFTDEKNDSKTSLLVPTSDGYLYRYNAETGAFLSQTDFTAPDKWDENVMFSFDTENGLMFLQLGDTLNIIETETWYEETSIQRCFGYHVSGDRFYVYSHPDETVFSLGYFEQYSVDDLIRKAKDILKDNEMPDGVKAEYGIELTEE